jgi:hypothetical protein
MTPYESLLLILAIAVAVGIWWTRHDCDIPPRRLMTVRSNVRLVRAPYDWKEGEQ